ncbi:hypothetical protein E4U40_006096 [Claviceps sp. LM458 group G5]|nr:hypothetical protein E4U40_006096 [Claviceps sp. LM458 group G5]
MEPRSQRAYVWLVLLCYGDAAHDDGHDAPRSGSWQIGGSWHSLKAPHPGLEPGLSTPPSPDCPSASDVVA